MNNTTDLSGAGRNAPRNNLTPHDSFPVGPINLAFAVFAALIWLWQAARASTELNLLGDFVYFWQAGHMWAMGQSPYLADYISSGAERFSIFTNPFFYPPNTLPFLSLMAPLSPRAAANALTLLSVASMFGVITLITQSSRVLNARLSMTYVFIILILFVSLYMRPSIRIIMYGQITWILALGCAAFIYGMLSQRRVLTTAGLVLLLLKPQFGLPALVFALMQATTRTSAITAIIATGVFGVIGLSVGDPIENLRQLLQNVSIYSSLPENNAMTSGGLNQLFSMFSYSPPKLAQIAIALAPAAVLARYARGQAAAPAGACAALCWAFFALPSHSTDFILLLPAAAYLFSSAPLSARIMIGVAFVILGRSWNLVDIVNPPGFDQAVSAGFIHTIGFALLMAGLCRAVFHAYCTADAGGANTNRAPRASLSTA
ncbi:MAG: glycosyltransferase 87 family protein [Pseudomonadota bacterium]